MVNIPEMKKGTAIFLVVCAVLSVIGTLTILGTGGARLGDLFRTLKELSPRVMSILALPFLIVAVVVARYMIRKSEERMWKNALLKTRAAREKDALNKK